MIQELVCALCLKTTFTLLKLWLNDINNHFTSKFLPTSQTGLPVIQTQNDWHIEILEQEVFLELVNLNSRKSSPSTDIPSRLLVQIACTLATVLHSILVQSFSNLQVPNSWKVAEVTPVPKCLPIALKQLRPISKLPTLVPLVR